MIETLCFIHSYLGVKCQDLQLIFYFIMFPFVKKKCAIYKKKILKANNCVLCLLKLSQEPKFHEAVMFKAEENMNRQTYNILKIWGFCIVGISYILKLEFMGHSLWPHLDNLLMSLTLT